MLQLIVALLLSSGSASPQPTPPSRGDQAVQAPPGARRDAVTPEQVKAAIDKLGSVDFPVRMEAGRTVRRAEQSVATPALVQAVTSHADQYVRFRALVILSGFNDPNARELMLKALPDKNDRVRTTAYAWFEHNPDPTALPHLIEALGREESEFVRPALTRALAANAAKSNDPKLQSLMTGLVMKGQDLFRAAVIDALGDYRAVYAFKPIVDVAKLDGPLQDDAVIALGRLGDKRGLETLSALQRSTRRNLQPSIAAAICLLGSNCSSHQGYLIETLKFAIANPGFQELLRATVSGLAELAIAGSEDAAAALFELGGPTRDPERAATALAIGHLALRNTPLTLKVLERQPKLDSALELVREAFDMLEEDFEEEHFYVNVRRAYWQAPEKSPSRRICEALIKKLEF